MIEALEFLKPKVYPINPMLCEASEPFDSPKHLFEIKWDGTRCISYVSNENTILQNRRFVNITKRYPEIKIQLTPGINSLILDGEIVVMVNGVPSFSSLQHREHVDDVNKINHLTKIYPASYIIFDILFVNDKDVTSLPLIERKKLLKDVVVKTENVFISDYILEKGKQYFEAATSRNLEGVVAKEIDSPYVIGKRTKYWLKIKKKKTIDAVICGITEGEGWRACKDKFGSLILGCYNYGELRYIGKAGTGLDLKDFAFFDDVFKLIPEIPNHPFTKKPKSNLKVKKWFEPLIVVEIEFMEITKDLKLREPRFKRVRTDKYAEECEI